jgi:hypothetical protein
MESLRILTWISCLLGIAQASDTKLLLLPLASDDSDGHVRFFQSVEQFGLDAKVVEERNIEENSNDSHKIEMLLEVLAQYKNDKNLLVMVTNSTDSIVLAGKDVVVSKFMEFNSDIVFAAEKTSLLDKPLAERFPRVILGKRFLSSKG